MAALRLLSTLTLLVAALASVAADVSQRCTEQTEGEPTGAVVTPEPLRLAAGKRRHDLLVPIADTCGIGTCRGLIVTVCDVIPPQVLVSTTAGEPWLAPAGDGGRIQGARVEVLRLGPLWAPLLVEYTLFCEPRETQPTPYITQE